MARRRRHRRVAGTGRAAAAAPVPLLEPRLVLAVDVGVMLHATQPPPRYKTTTKGEEGRPRRTAVTTYNHENRRKRRVRGGRHDAYTSEQQETERSATRDRYVLRLPGQTTTQNPLLVCRLV